MRTPIDCLVITPVGPKSTPAYVADTVESFLYFMGSSRSLMLLLDDSHGKELRRAIRPHAKLRIVDSASLLDSNVRHHNTRGLLFVKQMLALERLSADFTWSCLLRLDDDALLLGPAPHLDALEKFEGNPSIGMLGAYERRGDGSDKRQALAKQGRRLMRQIVSRTGLMNPAMSLYLMRLIVMSKRHGYRLGDMCTGGAFFMSGVASREIQMLWRRDRNGLVNSTLADDLLFALHIAAAGYSFEDFSDRDHIMAINWRGLPMPLEELVSRRKKIVHPVKDPGDPDHEIHVRSFFKEIRGGGDSH